MAVTARAKLNRLNNTNTNNNLHNRKEWEIYRRGKNPEIHRIMTNVPPRNFHLQDESYLQLLTINRKIRSHHVCLQKCMKKSSLTNYKKTNKTNRDQNCPRMIQRTEIMPSNWFLHMQIRNPLSNREGPRNTNLLTARTRKHLCKNKPQIRKTQILPIPLIYNMIYFWEKLPLHYAFENLALGYRKVH